MQKVHGNQWISSRICFAVKLSENKCPIMLLVVVCLTTFAWAYQQGRQVTAYIKPFGDSIVNERTAMHRFQQLRSGDMSLCDGSRNELHSTISIFYQMHTSGKKWVLYDNTKRSKHWLSSPNDVHKSARLSVLTRKIILCFCSAGRQVVHHEVLSTR